MYVRNRTQCHIEQYSKKFHSSQEQNDCYSLHNFLPVFCASHTHVWLVRLCFALAVLSHISYVAKLRINALVFSVGGFHDNLNTFIIDYAA